MLSIVQDLSLDLDAVIVVRGAEARAGASTPGARRQGKGKEPAASAPAAAPVAVGDAVCVPGTRLVPEWKPCSRPTVAAARGRGRGGVRGKAGVKSACAAPNHTTTDSSSEDDDSDGQGGFPADVRTVHKDIALLKAQFPSTCVLWGLWGGLQRRVVRCGQKQGFRALFFVLS